MAKKIKTIHQTIPALLPWLIAETLLEKEGYAIYGEVQMKEMVSGLVARANFHFNTNENFKKNILSKAKGGNAGRDYLYTFMNHWIEAKYWERYGFLPDAYKPYKEEV